MVEASEGRAGPRIGGPNGAAKRLFDVVGAAGALALLGPPMLLIAAAIRLSGPGGALYRQRRITRGGREFTILKFRTMRAGAEDATGPVWASAGDPRVTRLGRLLRRTSLDELPQLINVLRGEMSIVGPRPERPQLVRQISEALPIYRVRHAVRPGITGWAQVNYSYGSSVEDARIKLEYDLYYLKHAGVVLDLLILLRTVPVMLRAEGT